MSAPPTDLDPVSDNGDCTGPDFDLSGLDDLEYVTMRVTGGIISGANGAAQPKPLPLVITYKFYISIKLIIYCSRDISKPFTVLVFTFTAQCM